LWVLHNISSCHIGHLVRCQVVYFTKRLELHILSQPNNVASGVAGAIRDKAGEKIDYSHVTGVDRKSIPDDIDRKCQICIFSR